MGEMNCYLWYSVAFDLLYQAQLLSAARTARVSVLGITIVGELD